MCDNKLTKEMKNCHEHAAFCQQQANRHCDADERKLFLDMARRWLILAQSYERVGPFINTAKN